MEIIRLEKEIVVPAGVAFTGGVVEHTVTIPLEGGGEFPVHITIGLDEALAAGLVEKLVF